MDVINRQETELPVTLIQIKAKQWLQIHVLQSQQDYSKHGSTGSIKLHQLQMMKHINRWYSVSIHRLFRQMSQTLIENKTNMVQTAQQWLSINVPLRNREATNHRVSLLKERTHMVWIFSTTRLFSVLPWEHQHNFTTQLNLCPRLKEVRLQGSLLLFCP